MSVRTVRDLEIPGPRGEIPARLYSDRSDPVGVLMYFHGGGWVVGSIDGSDDQVRALARTSSCAIVSVDYGLAPEHPFPAGLEDAFAATDWACRHPEEFGAPGYRIAVGGDSAGANLAAAVALKARNETGPKLGFQLLIYPALARQIDTFSRVRFGSGFWLTTEDMDWYWAQYLGSTSSHDPYAEPLEARSLKDLPAAFLAVAGCDLLRDEGLLYAQRLTEDGVRVTTRDYHGQLHGFAACAGIVDAAWDLFEDAGNAVRAGLLGIRSSSAGVVS